MLTRKSAALLLLTLGAAAGLGACSSTPDDYSYRAAEEIRDDVTPELDGLSRRAVDRDNDMAMSFDTNGRAFNDDIDRALFLNTPSRLTPYPHPR
jgi:hypothetical protein